MTGVNEPQRWQLLNHGKKHYKSLLIVQTFQRKKKFSRTNCFSCVFSNLGSRKKSLAFYYRWQYLKNSLNFKRILWYFIDKCYQSKCTTVLVTQNEKELKTYLLFPLPRFLSFKIHFSIYIRPVYSSFYRP